MGFTPLRKDKPVRVQKFHAGKLFCAKNKTHRSGKAGPMRMGKSVCSSTAAGLDAGLADEKSQSR
jgi:hypothetical protein